VGKRIVAIGLPPAGGRRESTIVRYTKRALLVFGTGLALGFLAVMFDGAYGIGRIASVLMAAGLAALPVTALVDWRQSALALRRLERQSAAHAPPKRPAPKRPASKRPAPQRPAPKRPAEAAAVKSPAQPPAKKPGGRKPAGSRPS
jgi:hypothetical protein